MACNSVTKARQRQESNNKKNASPAKPREEEEPDDDESDSDEGGKKENTKKAKRSLKVKPTETTILMRYKSPRSFKSKTTKLLSLMMYLINTINTYLPIFLIAETLTTMVMPISLDMHFQGLMGM